MLLTEYVEIEPNCKNFKHYKSLGYDCKVGKSIRVNVSDLTKGSHAIIDCTCDYCGDLIDMPYREYYKKMQGIIPKIACYNCRGKKTAESNMSRYGVRSVSELPDYKEKVQKTCYDKYGVLNYTQTDEYKERYKQTVYNKYGYTNISQVPQFREKITQTYFNNGVVKTSKQQRYICDLYEGLLNYPIKYYNVDLYIKDDNIAVEYNGSGHWLSVKCESYTLNEFKKRETIRYKFIKGQGVKQMFITSRKDYLPSDEILQLMLANAKCLFQNSLCHWVNYDIDNNLIRSSLNKDGLYYNFGKLRKIQKEVK